MSCQFNCREFGKRHDASERAMIRLLSSAKKIHKNKFTSKHPTSNGNGSREDSNPRSASTATICATSRGTPPCAVTMSPNGRPNVATVAFGTVEYRARDIRSQTETERIVQPTTWSNVEDDRRRVAATGELAHDDG